MSRIINRIPVALIPTVEASVNTDTVRIGTIYIFYIL